jgi:hypothetical protein
MPLGLVRTDLNSFSFLDPLTNAQGRSVLGNNWTLDPLGEVPVFHVDGITETDPTSSVLAQLSLFNTIQNMTLSVKIVGPFWDGANASAIDLFTRVSGALVNSVTGYFVDINQVDNSGANATLYFEDDATNTLEDIGGGTVSLSSVGDDTVFYIQTQGTTIQVFQGLSGSPAQPGPLDPNGIDPFLILTATDNRLQAGSIGFDFGALKIANFSLTNAVGLSFKNGIPVILPENFGTVIIEPKNFGTTFPQTDSTFVGNPVTWTPDPAHFGNIDPPLD